MRLQPVARDGATLHPRHFAHAKCRGVTYVSGIKCYVTTIACLRAGRVAKIAEYDRAVVLEKFEQNVEGARLAHQSEGDVELAVHSSAPVTSVKLDARN